MESPPAWALLPPESDWDWLADAVTAVTADALVSGALVGELAPRPLRCLDATHAPECVACAPPPPSGDERSYELLRDVAGRPGERRARALLALTPEWASSAERELLATAAEADSAAAHLVRALRHKDVSQLRKRDVFALARAWGLRADVWRRRGAGRVARPAAGAAAECLQLSRAAALRLACPLEAYVASVLCPVSRRSAGAYRCAAAATLAAAQLRALPPAVTPSWVAAVRAARCQPPGKAAWNEAAARAAERDAAAAPAERAWRALRGEHPLEARLRTACTATGTTAYALLGPLRAHAACDDADDATQRLFSAWRLGLETGDDACDEAAALAAALLAERRSNGSAAEFLRAVAAIERFIAAQAALYDAALDDHCAWVLAACAALQRMAPQLPLGASRALDGAF